MLMLLYKKEITIESSLKNVETVSKIFQHLHKEIPVDKNKMKQINLSIVEVVNNTIEHTYNFAKKKFIDITFLVHDDKLVIKIIDTGKKLEKINLKPELLLDFDNISNLPQRGRGIFIVNKFMDKIKVDRENGKNIWEITKLFKK